MKKNSKIVILFILVGLLLFGFLGFKIYNDFFKDREKTKELDYLELYGYSLTDKDTKVFKNEFETLRTVLNNEVINYDEYAKSMSKLFIIDLYTINNKLGSTDVGGTEFIHPDMVSNFIEGIGSSLYKNVEINIEGDRTQKLPEVKEVTISSIEKTKFRYLDVEYDSYLVKASWTYVEDLGYQSSSELTLIESNKKLYVVKSK